MVVSSRVVGGRSGCVYLAAPRGALASATVTDEPTIRCVGSRACRDSCYVEDAPLAFQREQLEERRPNAAGSGVGPVGRTRPRGRGRFITKNARTAMSSHHQPCTNHPALSGDWQRGLPHRVSVHNALQNRPRTCFIGGHHRSSRIVARDVGSMVSERAIALSRASAHGVRRTRISGRTWPTGLASGP
jgi:hypothetical protein